jgi:hypothetical protein
MVTRLGHHVNEFLFHDRPDLGFLHVGSTLGQQTTAARPGVDEFLRRVGDR